MHRRRALIAGALAALWGCGGDVPDERAAAGRARVDPRCDGREIPLVSPGGVGPAQLGVRITRLAAICRVTDTALTIAEGLEERGHVVHFGDHAVLAVSTGTADTSIARIIVRDSAFRTPQGLGVGSMIGEMRALYPLLGFTSEEQRVVSIAALPGISFAYEGENLPADPARAFARRPEVMDAARVTSFWIYRPIDPAR